MRAALLALVLCSACDESHPAPYIERLAPVRGAVGAEVEILGSGFCVNAPPPPADAAPTPVDAEALPADAGRLPAAGSCEGVNGFVTFGARGVGNVDGGTLAGGSIVRWTDTRITATVPQMVPGTVSVVVTVNGVPSNARDFEVLP